DQVGAIGEGAVAKIGQTFADDDVGEAGAASERAKRPTPGPDSIADIGDVIRDRDPSQAGAPLKSPPRLRQRASLYRGDALADANVGKVWAAGESPLSEVGDGVRDGDAGHVTQAGHAALASRVNKGKRGVPDAGDRQAGNGAGDDHIPTWPGITSDCDRSVGVG